MSCNAIAGCRLPLLPILHVPLLLASYWERHAPSMDGVLLPSFPPSQEGPSKVGVDRPCPTPAGVDKAEDIPFPVLITLSGEAMERWVGSFDTVPLLRFIMQ